MRSMAPDLWTFGAASLLFPDVTLTISTHFKGIGTDIAHIYSTSRWQRRVRDWQQYGDYDQGREHPSLVIAPYQVCSSDMVLLEATS